MEKLKLIGSKEIQKREIVAAAAVCCRLERLRGEQKERVEHRWDAALGAARLASLLGTEKRAEEMVPWTACVVHGGVDINSEVNLGQWCSNFGQIEGARRGDLPGFDSSCSVEKKNEINGKLTMCKKRCAHTMQVTQPNTILGYQDKLIQQQNTAFLYYLARLSLAMANS